MPESGLAPPPPLELAEELADEELELAEELADEELELAEEDDDAPPPPLDELPLAAPVLARPDSSNPSSLRAPQAATHARSKSQARMS